MKISLQKLLDILLLDSRSHYSDIGSRLNMSQQGVSQRIKSLESEKIITGYPSIIDPAYLGFSVFHVSFNLKSGSGQEFKEFKKTLFENNFVTSIFELEYGATIFITVCTQNASRFNKEIDDIAEKHSKFIQKIVVLSNIVTHNFFPYFSSHTKNRQDVITSGDRELIDLSDLELQTLNELRLDSRISALTLSEKLGKSPQTILNTLKNLKKKKVLKGHTISIAAKTFDYNRHLLLIKTEGYHRMNDKSISRFFLEEKSVVRFHKTIGEYNLVIELITDPKNLIKTVSEINEFIPSEKFNLLPVKSLSSHSFIPELKS